MSAWKILLTDGLDEVGKTLLQAEARVDDREGITADELLRVAGDYEALIVRGRTKVTEAVFNAATQLKVVGRAGVGVDNIDLAAANQHGVTVVNSPLATTLAVAEHTLALMLALARSVPRADSSMKAGQWLKKEFMGVELFGKTLGVVGLGNIGSAVAVRAAALGMSVVAYEANCPNQEVVRRGAQPVSLEELLQRSDYISLHVPLTPETRNLLNGQVFSQMKRGVRIISTARGGIIDETALLGALESGQVAGAALDVFAQEPPGMAALVTHPRVIATPHVAAQTVESQRRASLDIAQEILAALKGKPLRWKVV
jgi:D-3-phosphoglycerate dehydrogenase